MSLSSEYSSIVDERCAGKQLFCDHDAYKIAIGIAEDCQKLAKEKHAALEKRIVELSDEVAEYKRKANKPVRELTDSECQEIWDKCPLFDFSLIAEAVRWIVKAYLANQNEPDEIPFDQAKLDAGGWTVKIYYSCDGTDWAEPSFAEKVTLVRK